jgi:hypothetical protein
MITVNYNGGGFGNLLFQYCFARLLAEVNNLNFHAEFPFSSVIQPKPPVQFQNIEPQPTVILNDDIYFQHRCQHDSKVPILPNDKNYVVSGYFQDALLFNNYRDIVKNFFILPNVQQNTTDTLITIRLGDFIHDGYNSEIIHYDWYNYTMQSAHGKKVLLVCDNRPRALPSTIEQEKKYIDQINFDDILIHKTGPDLKKDFELRLQYKNTICSNSTFSWWGAFLSEADNITTFAKFGHFGPNMYKCHGHHINQLFNIKNLSVPIDGEFIDITQL